MRFAPTDEQQHAISQFKTGEALKISAFAGAGKTSTLRFLADTRSRAGLYIAFNKSIALEAREKFPRNVDCRTTHSLAFRPVSAQFRFSSGKMTTALNARQLAEAFELKDRVFGRIKLDPVGQAFLALGTVRRYSQSDVDGIAQSHVPRYGRLAGARVEELAEIHEFVLENAHALWAKMTDHRDRLPLGHDGYLKLWALQKPKIAADYILLDEAQDSNPVVLGVLALQKAQMVYVGDRHQQIYEWRGAVNAMEKITGCPETYLTQSFRFGPEIAEAASSVLTALGETRPLQGNPSVKSFIGPIARPMAILARTNAGVMSEVIETLGAQRAPHVVGGVKDLVKLLNDVVSLKANQPGVSPEFFGFTSWTEVLQFVQEEEGEALRMLVQLVERFGELHLLWAMRRVADDEKGADVIISTGHKAKGREWDSVRLSQDFVSSRPDRPATVDDAECRLFYVAMTRAKKQLDVAPETLAAFASRVAALQPQPTNTQAPRQLKPPPLPRRSPSPPPLSKAPPTPVVVRRGLLRRIASMWRGAPQ